MNYSRHTGTNGRVQDGRGEGLTQRWRKGRRNIDDEDGTGEHANAENRESQDQNVEIAAHEASDDSRGGKAGTGCSTAAPENHKYVQQQRQSSEEQGDDQDKSQQHQREGD